MSQYFVSVVAIPQADQQPTAYQVNLSNGTTSWSVSKYYAHFESLHSSLSAMYGQYVPMLPQKDRSSSSKEQQTNINRANLEKYVSDMLSNIQLAADGSVSAFFELYRGTSSSYSTDYNNNNQQQQQTYSGYQDYSQQQQQYSGYDQYGNYQQPQQQQQQQYSGYDQSYYGNYQQQQPQQQQQQYSGYVDQMAQMHIGGDIPAAAVSPQPYSQSYDQTGGYSAASTTNASSSSIPYVDLTPTATTQSYGDYSSSSASTTQSYGYSDPNNYSQNYNATNYSQYGDTTAQNQGFAAAPEVTAPKQSPASTNFRPFGNNNNNSNNNSNNNNNSSINSSGSVASNPFSNISNNSTPNVNSGGGLARKSSFGGGGNVCAVCNKTVYMAEGMVVKGTNYHKLCFKCATCGCNLNMSNYATHRDIPYCKEHQRVKEKEDYVALNSERSKVHVPVSSQVNMSAEAAIAAGGSICAGCNNVVYAAECVKAGGRDWHRGCFRCMKCHTTLTVAKVGFHKGIPFCTAHHQQIVKAEQYTKNIDFSSMSFLRKLRGDQGGASPAKPPPQQLQQHHYAPFNSNSSNNTVENNPFKQQQQQQQQQQQSYQQQQQGQQQGQQQDKLPMHGTKLFVPYDVPKEDQTLTGVSEIDIAEPYRGRPPPGVVEGLLMMLSSPSDSDKAKAAAALCHICSETDSNRELVAEMGVIPPLLNMLKMQTPDKPYVQATAAACLCNLAANMKNKELLAQQGAIAVLISVLGSQDSESAAQSAGALWSLCVDSDNNKERLAQAGAIPRLIALMNSDDYFAQAQAAGALSECSIRVDENKMKIAEAGGVPRLAKLLDSADVSVQRLAACALCNICANHDQNKRLAREAQALPKLINLTRTTHPAEVQSPAAGAICNLAMNCPENRDAFVQLGAVTALKSLLTSEAPGVKDNAQAALDQLV